MFQSINVTGGTQTSRHSEKYNSINLTLSDGETTTTVTIKGHKNTAHVLSSIDALINEIKSF